MRLLLGRRAWICAVAAAVTTAGVWWIDGRVAALLVVASAGVVWYLVPPLGRFVRRRDVVAQPGGRAVHARPTPLMGGIALYLPIAMTLLFVAVTEDPRAFGLFGAVTLMGIAGAIDDVWGMRARHKLLLQILGAGLLLLGGYRIESLSLEPLGTWHLGWLGVPILVGWVLSVTNAFNLVDGIDGLAGMMAFVAAAAGLLFGSDALIAAALAGACIGFLRHNLPRAGIFLGDTGSLVLGMTVAGLALTLPPADNLALAIALVAYPAGDVTISIIRRVLRGKPPFTPDKSHVHHKIIACSHSPVRTLIYLLGFAGLLAALPSVLPGSMALAAIATCWGVLIWAVVRVCKVRIEQMVRHRPHFRHLHVVRKHVLADLHHALHPEGVRVALRRLPEQLDLSRVHAFGADVSRSASRQGPSVRVPLRLQGGMAYWEYVPWTDDRTLDTELQAVVCDLLRAADRRLGHFAAVKDKRSVAESVR